MKAFGMDSGGWPVAPGSESSHYARHGLSRRAFIGGPAAAAAGPSLGSELLWPVAASAWSAENSRIQLKSDPSRDDERLWSAQPREEWDFLPLKMVMQSSLHAAARSTAVKG